MRELILEKLKQIEEDQHVKILLAVESGSRAWGFASPDSDYDVRFIYVGSKNDYLRLDERRDVIELPINEELDINGWDLQKALRLFYKSNPTLFEWLSSPIVYIDSEFADQLRAVNGKYFSSKKSLYHYISMAQGNYREYLKGEMVRAKKYLYVLRPILACKWILKNRTQPPMLFSELMKAELPPELTRDVEKLLDLKMHSPETKEIPRISAINDYLDAEIEKISEQIKNEEDGRNCSWDELNAMFLVQLS